VWNPAANLLCHTYQDFGPFGIVTYLLLGTAAGAVCARRVTHPASLTWAIAYLWCMLALLGIWTVPLTRGTEFWCALLAATTVAVLADRVGAGRTRRAGGSSPFLAAPPSPAPLP
jgi:peptidoglycan/LPS O-acetylase OafA/YrhL